MRKGQAALEFLMTYGWAILVVLAAIAALAYFGVLSPDRFIPPKCTISGGFGCADWKINAGNPGTVQLSIQNGAGSDFDDLNVTLNSSDCGGINQQNPVGPLANGQSSPTILTFTCANAMSSRFKGDITIDFRRANEQLAHQATGSISGSAE